MLQSCGTFTGRQEESSKAGMVAAGKSPRLKRQPESKSTTVRAEAATRLDGSTGAAGSAVAPDPASNPRATE
jgi:hypothetical protein